TTTCWGYLSEVNTPLKKKGQRASVCMVGPRERGERYIRMASDLGVEDSIMFMGAVSPDRIQSLMRAANVVVLPSRHDGWGVVISEAIAVGKAIIASDRCGAALDLISPGINGFLVKAGSVESLAEAMAAYIQDPLLATRHSARSLELSHCVQPDSVGRLFEDAMVSWRQRWSGPCLAAEV
ncbi:MAG: glycosyltransferase family 4 protein, partial [Verrucomicrobiales bacterium]|nr:glycosyltransferase family 4 protein [Verrucomicrobiales bacterium]